ncbi:hypothetical protein OROGR_009034 [Orobanche gracilis]
MSSKFIMEQQTVPSNVEQAKWRVNAPSQEKVKYPIMARNFSDNGILLAVLDQGDSSACVPTSIAEAIHVNIVRGYTNRPLMYSAQFIIDIYLSYNLRCYYGNISCDCYSSTLESRLGLLLRHGIAAASTYQFTGGYDRLFPSHTTADVIDDIRHVSTKDSLE